jgi:hypothetical protein
MHGGWQRTATLQGQGASLLQPGSAAMALEALTLRVTAVAGLENVQREIE